MEGFSSLNDGDNNNIRSTPLNDNQSNDNANNTSMMSMDEYKKIDKELFSGKIVKISDLSYGGFKKVYSVGDNAVACTRIDYDNNCNIVKEQVDLYDIDEIAYNAFTKVFDGMSAKIVAPCIEKKFTPLSNKLLSNNYPTLDIDFLFQCLLLNCFCPIYKTKRLKSYKDGLLQLKNKTKDKEFRDLIDNINRFIDYVLDEAEDCECTDDSNIDIPSSYLLNNEVFKKIFQFYNNYNDKFSKETKEFLGKLFCYVLFTNKMDIKLENALLDESKNNIIHIDFIPTTSNSESKYGL